MKKALTAGILLFLFIIFINKGLAEQIKLADLPAAAVSKWICVEIKTKEILWRTVDKTELEIRDGKKIVHYASVGSGRHGKGKHPVKWLKEGYYFADPFIRPHSSKYEIYSQKDRLLKSVSYKYDYTAGKIFCTMEDKINNQTANYCFELLDDVLDPGCFGSAIASLPAKEKRDFYFHYLSDEGKMFNMAFKYRDQQKITIPAGTFDCYIYEMMVEQGGILKALGAKHAKTYFWFSNTNPPIWVKFQGLEGGTGTPYSVAQLTKYETCESN